MRPTKVINAFADRIKTSGTNPARLRIVILTCLLIYLSLVIALGYAWYSRQWVSAFHFFDDSAEWKQMDKVAHFFWTFQVSVIAARLMSWAGMEDRRSTIVGTIMGFVFVSSIEIPDGFSNAYGASVYDILANALGCSAFALQRIYWNKINIWPKFSFHPSSFAPLRPEVLGNGILEQVLKDYNGQTFWYSFSIKSLPLPSWLTLAVGVSAEGMMFGRDAENALVNFSPYRKFFISFDINLAHWQGRPGFLNSALHIFNIFKFPAPALEISSRGIRFHPLYF